MPRNVEIKARVLDPEGLAARAKAAANNDGTIIDQEDVFFKSANGRLKLRCVKGEKSKLIHYERPDQDGPKLSDFHMTLIDDAQGLKTCLAKSMGILGEVKKTRQLIMLGQTRIHLDNVENLGHFMELEVELRDDQTVEEGQKIAEDIMEILDIKKNDLIDGAYMDMLPKND